MPTVTTSETPTGAFPRSRTRTRCRKKPNAGARSSSTTASASQAGMPCFWLRSQYTKAKTIPTAPWAMLKTRVVL